MDENALVAAIHNNGDFAAFSLWSSERMEQYSGKREDGWLYIDGAIHIPSIARAIAAALKPQ